MKNLIFICCILIILFKTGNVLSNNNIFNVNNVEINKEIYKNKEKLVNKAFEKAFDELSKRLFLDDDYKKISKIDLKQIKKLVSYYQIINPEKTKKNKNIVVNVSFDKDRMHNFFHKFNILYSDIINTDVIIFPLLIKEKKYFIYTQNYFYDNWDNKNSENLIQYTLPVENIENIQKINLNKENIYKLNITDFFNEYKADNIVFVSIEINKDFAEAFLNTRIEGKKINKNLSIKKNKEISEKEFYNKIIYEIDIIIRDLIKSQNLIDVRTPSFLNVKMKLNSRKSNLNEFSNRIKNIDLIDNYFVQELNKDYILIKIKYLGKINKIMRKLKEKKIYLKMIEGQWQLKIT